MRHLKSIDEFNRINEQLFKKEINFFNSLFKGEEPKESPVSGDINISTAVSADKEKNVKALVEAMKKHNITNPYTQKAILGVIGKESGFVPKNEVNYSNTSAERIRNIFKKKLGGLPDSEIDKLKANPEAFFNKIYGGRYGNAENEGFKYRGRGFNGITFKGVYQKMQKLLDQFGKLGRRVDIVNNPDALNEIDVAAEVAVLYFIDRAADPKMAQKYGVSDINGFKDQETALKAMVNANAGWGTNIENDFLNNLAKAREQAQKFNVDNLA